MIFVANSKNVPIASLITIQLLETDKPVSLQWSESPTLTFDGIRFDSDVSVCRYLARLYPKLNLYGLSPLQHLEVDHWLSFGLGPLQNTVVFETSLAYLQTELSSVTFLVGHHLSIADIFVWSLLARNSKWKELRNGKDLLNVNRWFEFIESQACVIDYFKLVPLARSLCFSGYDATISDAMSLKQRKEVGKFIELPEAEQGKVVVRFPPEASGYLHIGHAKAALLNQHYKDKFEGKLIMRFDDTNPAKEKVDFEKVILEDLQLLHIKPDVFTHTSDYFDLMLEYCEQLLKEGKAYVDDTDPETMKAEREKNVESSNRNNSVAVNIEKWEHMLKGSEYGLKCCVRAKIDIHSPNGCLRDPTIYRCKIETHPKTGDKYNVYPTYDFACPIVDSIEGVTHCLRTTEYHDRDDQFYWFIDALRLRKPYIWEYSRLNMTNTVLSKRKLTWFVENGYVDGWDDPRFPTVRGIIRRGMTVAGLKQFIVVQGSSRSVVVMEWDKIWAFNKKVIDPIAPRYNALESSGSVPVFVDGVRTEKVLVPKHPKNDEVGKKFIWKNNKILIDRIDAEILKENENTTFINWGNLLIKKINRVGATVTNIEAVENLSNTDYKKTVKLTWLSELNEVPFVPCICVYFDHLISKPLLAKDEDFKQFINPNTKIEVKMLGDPELVHVKRGDIIQLQRRGFYICDQEYKPPSVYTSCGSPIILFFIPDGHTKVTPITAQSKKEIQNDVTLKKKQNNQSSNQKETKESAKTTENVSFGQPNTLDIAEVSKLLDSIKAQGDRVKQCKSDNCEKNIIDNEVKNFLHLRNAFKALTNVEWKPNITLEQITGVTISKSNSSEGSSAITKNLEGTELYNHICLQASKVRCMQTKKSDKNLINTELTVLADLKERYNLETGKSWTADDKFNIDHYFEDYINNLHVNVSNQGNKIRKLKSERAAKEIVDSEVKNLLELKAYFKEVTGSNYKPSENPPNCQNKTEAQEKNIMSNQGTEIHEKIVKQGNEVRKLKSDKSTSKEVIDRQLKLLLELKEEFKKATGEAWTPDDNSGPVKNAASKKTKPWKPDKTKKEQPKSQTEAGGVKKQTRLGLEVRKDENLPEWYTQVITKSELIEYYDVSGCYTLRPWAFAVWKSIRSWFDEQITTLRVDECYFPIFVSKGALEREKTHIADFAPEVAWVTMSGETYLEEPVAIRPTSETVMYPAYAKWIRSHRDLPLKLNQWNNVVRWEFKHPQPFLRTREFLWQEGHTAYATKKDAEDEVYVILDLYARVYTDLLAIPVVKGRKTEKEKFAGGDFTTTVEAFISASGRAIQGATSHHLGQNFSKMFDIVFEDPETNEKQFVYQNSWGLTTRTIGVMIMVHSDDQGLVLPPRVAKIQVVIVPCGISASLGLEERNSLDQSCLELEKIVSGDGIRVKYDSRDNYSSGWKFNHWELKGVPIRIELGPKDVKQNQVVAVRRDTGEKLTLKMNNLTSDIGNLLNDIQKALYNKAEFDLKSHTKLCEDWSSFTEKLNEKNIIISPFCGEIACEDKIKQDSARNEGSDPGGPSMGAKSLCIPFDQPKQLLESRKCIHPDCKNVAKFYTLFGRSY